VLLSAVSYGTGLPVDRYRIYETDNTGQGTPLDPYHIKLFGVGNAAEIVEKATLGLASHWPYIADFSGLSTYSITA